MLAQSTFRKSWLYLIGAAAAWGFASAISKRAVEEIPPLTLFPIQLGVSLLALGTIVILGRTRPERPGGIRTLAWLGVLNPGVAYSLGLVGLTQITASLSVVLWATEPLLILGLAVLILKERVVPRVAIASAAAVGGVLLIALQSERDGSLPGIALTLLGVLACAFYTIAAKRLLLDTSALLGLLVQQVAALSFAVVVLAASSVWLDPFPLTQVSGTAWASAIASGFLYYAVGFWLYLLGLRQTSATTAGSFLNLIPFFGIAAGFILLRESFTGQEWLGAALIVGSLTVVLLPARSRAAVETIG
jgi:probable blue pigment (indigoidine) exporter